MQPETNSALSWKQPAPGLLATLHPESDPQHPREDPQGLVTRIIAWETRLPISDHKESRTPQQFLADLHQEAQERFPNGPHPVVRTLYLHIHNGILLQVGSPPDLHDSQPVGFALVTPNSIADNGLTTREAHQALHGDVQALEDYLNDNVYRLELRRNGHLLQDWPELYPEPGQEDPYPAAICHPVNQPSPYYLDSLLATAPGLTPEEVRAIPITRWNNS